MFESDEFNNKEAKPPIEPAAFSVEEPSAIQPRRKQRKPKSKTPTKVRGNQRDLRAQSSKESEATIILVNSEDNTCEILSEEDLTAAGARVINDSNLTLFRAVRLEPMITFSNNHHT